MLIAGYLIALILSYGLYKESNKFDISDDSKIGILHLSIPFTKKYPAISYLLFSTLIYWLYFYIFEFKLFNVILFILILIMQMIIHIDIRCSRLPNKYVLPLIVASIILSTFQFGIKHALLGALVAFGVTFILGIIRVGGLGGGDIKFSASLGAILGYDYILVSICIMFILGGLVSLFLLLHKLTHRKDFIPYGPFFYLGFLLCLIIFYGEVI